MLFLQLGCNFNTFCVILNKPILSFQFRPPLVIFLPKEAYTVKTKSVYSKLRKKYWSYSLAVKTTFFTHYLSNLNPEEEGSSCKIDDFMDNYISKLKWAWQAQFLSQAPKILRKCTTFKDVQMMFLWLLDISTGFRFWNFCWSCHIQFLSNPWIV